MHVTRPISTARAALLTAGLVLALAAGGCGNMLDSDSTAKVLTERQRDSTIAKSVLPGAAVVGRAMAVSDRAAISAAKMDSLSRTDN